MEKIFEAQSQFFQQVPDTVRQYRKWIWGLFIILVVAIAPGAGKFKLDLSDEFFFKEDDPVKLAFDRFREEFGGDESFYIVYRALDGDVFSKDSLTALRNLQEDLLNYRLELKAGEKSPLDHIVDITSLINVSYLEASEDALISRQFVGDRIPLTQEQTEHYRQQAMAHPDYPLLYVSKDSKYGGMIIRTDFKTRFKENHPDLSDSNVIDELAPDEFDYAKFDVAEVDPSNINSSIKNEKPKTFEPVEIEDYSYVNAAIRAIIDKPEYANFLEYYPVGTPPMNAYIWDNLIQQVNLVMLLTLFITLTMLWLLFRSFAAVVWPVVIITAASLVTVALFGWLDLKMNMMINVTVLLILVVGVADSVHILSGYLYFRNLGKDHKQALNAAYEKAGVAVFLTSVTTAIGMLALLVVPLIPIQRFAMSAALGVMLAFLFTVFILPIMLDLWAPKIKKRKLEKEKQENGIHSIQVLLQKVEHFSHLKPNINIAVFSLTAVFFLFGITKIEVDSNFVNIFGEDSIIQKSTTLVDEKMGGTQSLEIMIDMGSDSALKQPEVLNAMDELQTYLEAEVEYVIITRSLVNIVKDSNQSLNSGLEKAYSIPQNPAVLQQTLFLFNNANPADRRKVVSDNYQKAHITVNFINMGSMHYTEIVDEIELKTAEIFAPLKSNYPKMNVSATGGLTIMLKMVDYLSWSQIQGFGVALLVISFILFFLFGSWRVGLIALFPNIFPLVVVFGSMGYLKIPLDVDTLIVAPLMIGIVVDDTIHFLTHYREEVIKHGDKHRAISQAFREVGQAIVFTSIILSAAFLTFLLLDHQGMKHFGLLSAVAITTALIAELFLLPALLLKFNVKFKPRQANKELAST